MINVITVKVTINDGEDRDAMEVFFDCNKMLGSYRLENRSEKEIMLIKEVLREVLCIMDDQTDGLH